MIGIKGNGMRRVFGLVLGLSAGLAPLLGARPALAQTVTPGTSPLVFTNAQVGVTAGSAETLTETFTITGGTSLITPTATMHYGLAYKVGAVTCTGAAGDQTCKVSVTFLPNYPGGRRDALFLMNGTTRLATVLAFGVGQSPFAMIQPGTVTNPISNNAHYLYDSVVDENGTVYVYLNSTIYSVTAAGVVTQLAVPGPDSNSDLSIDGAGVIYFGAPAAGANAFITYDTVQGIVSSVPAPVSALYFDGIASGNEGNIYMVDDDNKKLYTVKPDGTSTSLALTYDTPYSMVVDSNENLFATSGGSGKVDEITPAGVQTQVSTGGGSHIGIDAAATIYMNRYSNGVGELPASGYGTAVAVIDGGGGSTGNPSVAPDGTVYAGDGNNLDKVDRTQQTISFGEQTNGSPSQPAAFQIYNGGNETLTLATFAVTGEGFALQSGTTGACSAGMTIAPGALCNAPIVFTGTHSGNFTGSITFTSNTLNTTATSVSIPLSAYVNGIYVTVSPNTLGFGDQTDGTTSASKTVTFTNAGVSADASIGSPSSVDGFTISQGTCTSTIAPGSSCSFNVTFSPTAVQAYTGTVNVTAASDASTQEQSLSFTLNGTGTSAAFPPPPSVANLQFAPAVLGQFAGDFTGAYTGDGGPAIAATLNRPNGIAYDAAGNLYIADATNYVIRKVDTSGKISTFAGNGTSGYSGDGGPALSAQFQRPQGIAVDASGNVYVADQLANVVRKIDTSGTITLFAGNSGGNSGYFGDGGPATSAELYYPIGIAFDLAGNLYIADRDNAAIRMVDTSGNIHTVAGTGVAGYSGDGGAATSAQLDFPVGVAVDAAGNLYIADAANYSFRVVNKAGKISTFAGSDFKGGSCPAGSVPTACTFSSPGDVLVSPGGDIYLADAENNIYVIDSSGKIYPYEENTVGDLISTSIGTSDFLAATNGPGFIAFDANNQLLASNSDSNVVTSAGSTGNLNFPAQNIYTTSAAQFIQLINPGSVALSFTGTPTVTGPYALVTGGTCDLTKSLAPGASCTLGVTFTPTVDGASPGTIVLYSNATNSPSTIQLNGTGEGTATLTSTISPLSLTFTATTNTTSAAQTVTFTNTSPTDITISGVAVTANSGFAETTTCGTTLAAGAHCTISVTFSPTAATTYSGGLTVTSDSTSPATVSLSGTGTAPAAPAVTFSPTSLAFPSTTVGSTAAAMSTTLSNTGNATLNITGITLSDTTDFAETTTCGSTLAAGKTCSISVTFKPGAVQAYNATLSVADDAAGSPQTVALSGSGVGTVSVSPASIAFGNEEEYTESTPQKVTVTNGTSSAISFGTLVFSNGFVLYQDDCGSQLAANSSCYYLVSFYPKAVSSFTGTVSIPYSGGSGSPLTVNLSGTGTAGTPAISLYPAPLNFGIEPVSLIPTGGTVLTVQVDDAGDAPLSGIGVAIGGANAGDFTETDTCSGATATPGNQACTISVTFTASAAGPRNATLTVTSNGGAATASTTLTGAGVAQLPQLQFSPTQLNLFAGVDGRCGDTTTGGAATAATLCDVTGAAQDSLGNTYLVDSTYNVVYKVDVSGNLSVFAGTPSKTGGYTGDGQLATTATLSTPTAVATDAFGNVYISDTGNGAIREVIAATGDISTLVTNQCSEGGTGTPKPLQRKGGVRPMFEQQESYACLATLKPEGLVVDNSGNVFFADPADNLVWKAAPGGGLTLIAGDQVGGGAGTAGYNGDNIQATTAELNTPQDVALDQSGNVYIADTANFRVRLVTAATGVITTFAGTGDSGDSGDTGAATSAKITASGIATDLAGDVFITAGSGGVVRKVDASGNINTYAGGGTGAIGGPASSGAVANAFFARTDVSGDLLIPGGVQVLAAGPDGLLQFGSQPQGSTSNALNVVLENTGDSGLSLGTTVATVTGADAADFALTSSTCGYNLLPGKTCVLSVTFDPTATGARTASLSVPTNAAGSPQIVLLQGNGALASAPAASLSPTTLSFPNTAVGATAALSTTLSNTGTATLNISGITLSDMTDFAESTTCGTTLAAGNNCTITVTFQPGSATGFNGTLSVADDAAGSPQTVALSGTGTPAPVPVASLSPTTLSFPSTNVGSSSAALSTTLSNTGNATLTITGITLSDTTDFAETTTCLGTLAAGSNCTISVTFKPGSATALSGTLSVADNAAGSPQTVALSGTGLTPPATDFALSVTPAAVTVQAGSVATFTVNAKGIGGDFANAVNLTVTGLPPGATGSFSPASVTPGANGASSTLSIQTVTQAAMAQPRPLRGGTRSPWLAALLVVPLLGMRRRLRKLRLVSCAILLAATLVPTALLTGCGGGYFAITSQTYTVTVTGTSGSTTHSTTVTLTVQQ